LGWILNIIPVIAHLLGDDIVFWRSPMRLLLTSLLCVSLAAPVLAKPPLRDVAEIDDALMVLAIADELRKSCDGISARMIRALNRIEGLKGRARDLGYSSEEVKA
jgi:hypothetical protein